MPPAGDPSSLHSTWEKPLIGAGTEDKGARQAPSSFQKVEILIMKTKLLRSSPGNPRLPGEELCDAKKWGWKAYDSGGAKGQTGDPRVIEMTGYMGIHWKKWYPRAS